MKTRILAAAVCMTVCSGCNTTSLFSSRSGNGEDTTLAQLTDSAEGTPSDTPRLPPPTNRDPRPATTSLSTADEHVRLGEAELRSNRLTEAQQHFKQALAAQPDHAKANHRMGVVCDKLGQYNSAEKHYLVALQHDPRNVAVLSDLGYSCWLQKRYAESERYLLKARSIDPNYETAIANLGMLYGTTGRTDEAVAMFRQIGDDSQVEQIMQQVMALAASNPSENPPVATGPMTPASLAATDTTPTKMSPPAGDSSNTPRREANSVNDPTRELLELMDRAEQQQQKPPRQQQNEIQQVSWATDEAPQAQRPVPPFAQNRPPVPQPAPPQMAGVNPFQQAQPAQQVQPAVRPVGPAQVPDHLLNQALAQIDREGRTASTGPITVGPPARQPQSLSAHSPQHSTTISYGTPPTSTSQSPHLQLQQPVVMDPSRSYPPTSSPQAPYSTHGRTGGTESLALTENPAVPRQGTTMGRAPGSPEPSRAIAATGPDAHFTGIGDASGFQGHRSAMGGVDPASATESHPLDQGTGQVVAAARQPVEHALHEQQKGTTVPVELVHGSNSDSKKTLDSSAVSAVTSTNPWAASPSESTGAIDPYQQARRQAAIMGLGVGPGQMFPYIHQTMRAAPGSDSRWNGAQYPAPERSLPSDMTPADLATAVQPPRPETLNTPSNFQGQALPQISAQVRHPQQYGATPAPAPGNTSPVTSINPLASYDEVRRQQSDQLSGMVNQTYGQSPQAPPYNPSAPQSQLINAPADSTSGGNVWDLRPTGSPQHTTQQTATPGPRVTNLSAVVVPEPYRKSADSGSLTPSIHATGPSAPSQFESTGDGPVIVPKYR